MREIAVGPINKVADYIWVLKILELYGYAWVSGDSLVECFDEFYPGIYLFFDEDKLVEYSHEEELGYLLIGADDLISNPERYLTKLMIIFLWRIWIFKTIVVYL